MVKKDSLQILNEIMQRKHINKEINEQIKSAILEGYNENDEGRTHKVHHGEAIAMDLSHCSSFRSLLLLNVPWIVYPFSHPHTPQLPNSTHKTPKRHKK